MAGTTRWVVLDGSSPAFEFNGTWREETANQVHQSTLQTTTLDGSKMTFRFNGSEMILFGKTKAGGGGARPTVNCSVDSLATNPDPRATGEDFACWWPTSDDDGTHTFLLNTTIPGSGDLSPSVSIDSLWFHPSFDSSISDEDMLVMYDNHDPHIQFSPGDWEILQDPDDNGVASTTNRIGATLSVVFLGTRIVWEGWRAAGSGIGRSSGTFFMDNGPPVTFNIDPSTSQTATKGITFIEVGGLSAGPHNLTVVYNGPSAPLILDHFLVKGGNFRIEGPLESIVPSSSQDSASPTSSSAPHPSSSSRAAPIGAIVGGVVGGLVALALAIFAVLCAKKDLASGRTASDCLPVRQRVMLRHLLPTQARASTRQVLRAQRIHLHQYEHRPTRQR